MNYSYEILKAEPQHQFLSVRYYAEGRDNYFKNFNINTWETEEDIKNIIKGFAPTVIAHWIYQETAPEIPPLLEGFTENAEAVLQEAPTTADAPSYDSLTQYITTQNQPDENNIIQWIISDYSEETKMSNVRNHRDILLQQTDWMMFSDTATPSQAWLDYRQALRDVPSQAGFPDNIVWPTKP